MTANNKLKLVCIGGGTGQALLLSELKNRDADITAIVTVLDSGRSSGIIRNEFGMPAPGDMRNCMLALSDGSEWLKTLLQYRFEKYIPGMNLGNLMFAAAAERNGDFESAVSEISEFLNIKGKVYPSTFSNIHLIAELESGERIEGESEIISPQPKNIHRIRLQDENAEGFGKAADAIMNADIILIGPGAFYTSVLVHFLMKNIREAFIKSKAVKFYIQNLAVQAGVTNCMSVSDYLLELHRYIYNNHSITWDSLKPAIDFIVLNEESPKRETLEEYESQGSGIIFANGNDIENIKNAGIMMIRENLMLQAHEKEWGKLLYMRHDASKLSNTIFSKAKNELEKRSAGRYKQP